MDNIVIQQIVIKQMILSIFKTFNPLVIIVLKNKIPLKQNAAGFFVQAAKRLRLIAEEEGFCSNFPLTAFCKCLSLKNQNR